MTRCNRGRFELVLVRSGTYCFSKVAGIGLKSLLKSTLMQLTLKAQSDGTVHAWKSFEVERGAPGNSLLILCDHATSRLPPEYGTLGLNPGETARHIAYDIGAREVALGAGRRLQATVISSCFSRLLIDPNRGEDDPTLIMQLSDGTIIPGNVGIGEAEQAKRIDTYYAPYHAAIGAELDAMITAGLVPVIASIHSFTEAWRGIPRKWHAAVLWDNDPRLALPLLRELRSRTGAEIGDNEPYTGHLRNDSMYRHATLRGLPNSLIEIRQDLIRDSDGQAKWAAIIADCLAGILADPQVAPALSRIEYLGSKTDIIRSDNAI
jgi:predicted N-formylglutamate amidohydrolase